MHHLCVVNYCLDCVRTCMVRFAGGSINYLVGGWMTRDKSIQRPFLMTLYYTNLPSMCVVRSCIHSFTLKCILPLLTLPCLHHSLASTPALKYSIQQCCLRLYSYVPSEVSVLLACCCNWQRHWQRKCFYCIFPCHSLLRDDLVGIMDDAAGKSDCWLKS